MSPPVAAVAVALVVLLLWSTGPEARRDRGSRGWLPRPILVAAPCLLVPRHWVIPLLILVATATAGRVLWRRHQEARQAEATAVRLVEVCDVLAAELASGRPPELALEEAAGAWNALRPVADASRLGGDVPATLRAVAATPGADGLRLLAGAWAVSHRTGTGLAASTRRVADAVRLEQATRRVVVGELSSARATAKLVAVLPVLALLMGSGAGADPWRFLVHTPLGLACLTGGLTFGFTGLWWIELIAREVDR